MAQHFKYNTGATINNTTQKGNLAIATSGTYDWGPTSSTGYYPETSPPDNGYTIYYMKPSGEPSVHVARSTSIAVTFLKSFGATGTTITEVLSWATAQTNYFVQTGTTVTYSVGQSALGGIVAYILQSGDPGYDANVQHGLVAATSSSAVIWGCSGTTISGTSTALGTGQANTNLILAGCAARPIAASVAAAHNGGGYTDWYLPSLNEVSKLYDNRVAIGMPNFFQIWSSSQYSSIYAYNVDFGNGGAVQGFGGATWATNYIRPVRSF